MTLRALATASGLSASCISSIEKGRNPITGRPPQPSAGAFERLCDILRIERSRFPAPAACPHRHAHPEHVLLYRLDSRRDGMARILQDCFGDQVGQWLGISDPNTDPEPAPDFHPWRWQFGKMPYASSVLETSDIITALTAEVDARRDLIDARPYGIFIADCSMVMRWVVNPDAEIAFEEHWYDLPNAVLDKAFGRLPVINLCCYHQLDLETLASRVDLHSLLISLISRHDRFVATGADGSIVQNEDAVRMMLHANRPAGLSFHAWDEITWMIIRQKLGVSRRPGSDV